MRMNRDRISSLPDELIAKILSFIGTKQAVQTSLLSSRWRFLWKKISYLNLSSNDFSTLPKFHLFLTHVLPSFENQVQISLDLHGEDNSVSVHQILNLACSYNLQRLTFFFLDIKITKCPISLFSSHTLKDLTLIGSFLDVIPTSMWELPTLASLHLQGISFNDENTEKCVGFFSKCKNMKNLTLIRCYLKGLDGFTISHPLISNITFKDGYLDVFGINVIAPQLKNLTISNWGGKSRISAPNLVSLVYINRNLDLSFDVDSLLSLAKVDLCISRTYHTDARKVADLLQKFKRVKYLTVSLELIELLSRSVEVEPSPFVNVKSLRIYPEIFEPWWTEVSLEVKNYLQDTFPSATLTFVTREVVCGNKSP